MKLSIRFILLSAFLLLTGAICSGDEIYSKNRKANELYKQGKYDEALKLYDDALLLSPSDEKLKMNQGSALFKLGDLDKSEEAYNEALSVKDKKTKADAHYNMGNILFKKAEQVQQQDLQGAQEKLKSALNHYIESLDLRPDDVDAKWNLQLTHQKIKELQQQQQQQQKQDQQNKDNKDQKDKKDDKQQQNQDDKKEQQKPQDQKDQQEDKKEQQSEQQQQQSEMKESPEQKDMKKEDARRLIELYADDADSLNKPQKKAARPRQPEQDW